jgi:hypothetical protein
MASKSNISKVAYVYDEATDKWYPIAGAASTSADYSWTGDHIFESGSSVSFETVVKSKAGINNFLNPAARDAAITSPVAGLVAFVQQNAAGTDINDIQIYDGSRWRTSGDHILLSAIINPTYDNYTVVLDDAGTTLNVSSSNNITITIPANSTTAFKVGQKIEIIRSGTGSVSVLPAGGVTLNSKNGNRKIASQHSGAVLTKMDTNTWLLIGDLTA